MMKLVSTISMILICATSISAGSISVDVTNISNHRGYIRIGLYNRKTPFGSYKTYKNAVIKAAGDHITYRFAKIPKGEYAISVLHDENNNNKMDKTILGMPREGYGFSNNVRPLLRAASFEEAKFILDDMIKIVISLWYR